MKGGHDIGERRDTPEEVRDHIKGEPQARDATLLVHVIYLQLCRPERRQ